ncbi:MULTISPECIES: hypothetical protein [Vitreoscilla]|uniref:Uncharacterized protein n=1 Tax=Vitreoscilla stercoraria TaxID=61 RepID=A0ABY4EAM4_VITST|nr:MULTISPECIES: hypothetical protein [Vitreoscilla]QJQ52465.1 hypothetical protein ADP71_40930 [Vitreoscilla sp. C1]UOO92284.1 hypothetical protein LVJ81_11825 [Vitreoscilla stercoraria]
MSKLVEQTKTLIHGLDTAENSTLSPQQLVEAAWNQQDPRKIAEDLNALMQAMMETPSP